MQHQKILTAIKNGDIETLISNYNDIDTNVQLGYVEIAIKRGNLDIVKYLITKMNIKSAGMPVITASMYGRKDILEFLLEYGYDVNTTYQKKNALYHAINRQNLEIIKFLLEKKAYIHEKYGSNLLRSVVITGNLEIIDCIFNNTTGYNYPGIYFTKDKQLNCVYKFAIEYNKVHIVDYLLKIGLNLDLIEEKFVLEYYSPTTPDNISRLYKLYHSGVEIFKLKGMTVEIINGIDKKYNDIVGNFQEVSSNRYINKMIMEYV